MNPDADWSQSTSIWAARLASFAQFPDKRLDRRLAVILETLGKKPLDSFTQACDDWGQAKALYRFVDNPRVHDDNLRRPIVLATVERCRARRMVIVVQDTTSVSYSHLNHASGLGPVNDSETARGLHLHTTLALDLNGVPLGILDQQCWARAPGERTAPRRRSRPIEQKESSKWLRGLDAARAAVATIAKPEDRPELLHVMDREGDIHEVLESISATPDHAVIRCAQDRKVAGRIGLAHAAVRKAPLLAGAEIQVPAQTGHPARAARVEFRSLRVTITPASHKYPQRRPIEWTLLEAWEPNPPAGTEPLHWRLWTTETVTTLDQALAILEIYKLRWRIEEFHLTLKSGCRVEALELQTARRLRNALALYSAVAARIVALRDLARVTPDAPCTEVLSEDEWKALWAKMRPAGPRPIDKPPTMRQAILWIGRLGGHLNRKRDGMPGVRTLWRGLRDLAILVAGYRAGRNSH